jgi:Tfp pilus assembly protein PilO
VSKLVRTKAGVAAVAVALVVVLGGGGWFLLVNPKRSSSADLADEIATVESNIAARRAELARPSADVRLRVSDLYRLTKAMPSDLGIAGVMLEINRLAGRHGIAFTSITPSAAVTGNGYLVQPLAVTLQGRFSSVSRFLADLRRLVSVRKKTLDVRGRLFSVDDIALGQPDSPRKFPDIKASATINAFVYTGAPTPTGTPAGGPSATTPPEPTTPSASQTSAAGATP